MERTLAVGTPEVAHSLNGVIDLLKRHSVVPPGNDKCIGSCYESLVCLIDSDPRIRDFFFGVIQKRPSLTPTHAVNLIFRSIQHIQLNLKNDQSYLHFENPDKWHSLLISLLTSDDERDIFEELLLTKDTITTKFQRYSGPKAIISSFWNGNPVNVADFGCGTNVGLPGMELNTLFEPIADETPGQLVISEISKPTNIQVGLAIDKENPEDPEVKMWSIACSYYPKEIKELNANDELEYKFKGSKNTAFLQTDLLSDKSLHLIPKQDFDVVIMSTLLYQRTSSERKIIIDEANKALKPTGIIIIQDFAEKDPGNPQTLLFNGAWGGGEFGYRTFILRQNPKTGLSEIFKWSDGRCRRVKPGVDFDILLQEK